jgi:hypothetical protein
MREQRLADVRVVIHHQTEKALLVSTDGLDSHGVWVPKSVTEVDETSRRERSVVITLPERMAIDKGLV